MGKTCGPKAFSFQCMTKFTTKKKKKNKKKKNNKKKISQWKSGQNFLTLLAQFNI